MNGYYYSVTAKLQKNFSDNFFVAASYTRSESKTLNDGLGDQVTSVFSTNTYGKNGSNVPELGHSSYVTPNRVVVAASYKIPEGKHLATTLSAFYEGENLGYVGNQYSYTRWTYTMASCITGEGGAYNTIYIPTENDLTNMTFASADNKAAFNERIMNDKYLNSHRGQYAERGSQVMPWHNQLDLKLEQDFYMFQRNGRPHNIKVGVDVKNGYESIGFVKSGWQRNKYIVNMLAKILQDHYNNIPPKYSDSPSPFHTLAWEIFRKYSTKELDTN